MFGSLKVSLFGTLEILLKVCIVSRLFAVQFMAKFLNRNSVNSDPSNPIRGENPVVRNRNTVWTITVTIDRKEKVRHNSSV